MDRLWFSSRAEAKRYAREKYGRNWREKIRIEQIGFYRKAGWVIWEIKDEVRKKFEAARKLCGIWADKDTSFLTRRVIDCGH
jgi:hypothetical protein